LAGDPQLEGDGLRKAVSGRTVYLETPLGSLPISYKTNGTMQASTIQLAAYTRIDPRSRHVVGCCRQAVPALEQLAGRQVALFHFAPGRRNRAVDPRRRPERRRHHPALNQNCP
jgi:hypothetical protein